MNRWTTNVMTTLAVASILLLGSGLRVSATQPIPNRLVVLTFDDSVKSHFTVVRPILKRHGFKATFFITEGFDFATNKQDYMTWEEIAELHRDGFEIGNHTRDHMAVTEASLPKLRASYRQSMTAVRNMAFHSPSRSRFPEMRLMWVRFRSWASGYQVRPSRD